MLFHVLLGLGIGSTYRPLLKRADFLVAVFCTGVFYIERGFCQLWLLAEVLCQRFRAIEDASGIGARGVIVSLFVSGDSVSMTGVFRHCVVDLGGNFHRRSGTNAPFAWSLLLLIRHFRVQVV